MTTVSFYAKAGQISGFQVSGHSGYAASGSDIVCAAITSAVRLAEVVCNDVLGLSARVSVREQDAEISLSLTDPSAWTNETYQALMTGLMVYFSQLHEEYPKYIEVLWEEADEVMQS